MKTPILLGLRGNAGAGKDTAADHLVAKHGFIKMSLADEMKRFSKNIFGFSDQQLWGPSSFRNARDERYGKHSLWVNAADRIDAYGAEWAKSLFPECAPEAADRLIKWFRDIYVAYGPASDVGLSPRVVLQTIGTEYGRSINPEVWLRKTLDDAGRIFMACGNNTYTREQGVVAQSGWRGEYPTPNVVIPDCRFRNEVEAVIDDGGQCWWLVSDFAAKAGTVGVKGHQSETDEIPADLFRHIIHVEYGVENFQRQLDAIMKETR